MDAHEYEDVARLAYRFWEERGRPLGSPEVDWYQAKREIEARPYVMPPILGVGLEPGWSE
jgi:hypothetical protein